MTEIESSTEKAAARDEVSQLADDLLQGISDDIWYDAHDHGDEAGETKIESAQNAMQRAADLLPKMAANIEALYAFASSMAEKHGMNGDDTMTDEDHRQFREAAQDAAVLLQDLRASVDVVEDVPEGDAPRI